MSITVTLQLGQGEDIEALTLEGNELVLLQDDEAAFPLLSQLDNCSYDVFAQAEMPELLAELRRLDPASRKMADHLEDICRLVETAIKRPGSTVSFTPFD